MAAQNGIAVFVGLQSKQTYHISFYLDDTAGNPVRWSQAAKAIATSPPDWTPPEQVALIDFIIAAASGQTTTQMLRNGQPTGDYLLNAVYLASITTRPPLRIGFSPIGKVGANQLA